MQFDNWMIEYLRFDGLGDDRWESLGYSDTTNPNLPEVSQILTLDVQNRTKKLW